MKFIIEPAIFDKIPTLQVYVTIAKNMTLKPDGEVAIKQFLHDSWHHGAQACLAYANVQSHPHIQAWRECYQSLGISIKKFTCSVENLLKRAVKQPEPRSISPIVDLYNAVSVRHVMPFGAMDLDDMPEEPLELRFSQPGDTFMALDETVPSPVPLQEATYVCGHQALTRHINWKQSKKALVQNTSKNVMFVTEVLGGMSATVVQDAVAELESKLKELYGCQPLTVIMDKNNATLDY